MIAQELEVSLHMAFVEARQKRHEFITVEHLLLAMLDNPTAAEVMRACGEWEAARAGLSLTCVHEPVIQGTGGGIRGLRGLLSDGDFLVLNGDILHDLDVPAFLKTHRRMKRAATVALACQFMEATTSGLASPGATRPTPTAS